MLKPSALDCLQQAFKQLTKSMQMRVLCLG